MPQVHTSIYIAEIQWALVVVALHPMLIIYTYEYIIYMNIFTLCMQLHNTQSDCIPA